MSIGVIAARGTGEIVVWGDNSQLQVDGRPPGKDYTKLAQGGARQSLAITDDGQLKLWGGVGSANRVVPDFLATPLPGEFVEAGLGLTHLVGVRKDGSLAVWGDFFSIGPVLPPQAIRASAVSCSGDHDVAILVDGHLKEWGSIGPAPVGHFRKVRARGDYAIALRDDGRLFGWGGSLFATLADWKSDGEGHFYIDGPFKDIAAGVISRPPLPTIPHVLALHAGGHVQGWGANSFGEANGSPAGVVFKTIAAGLNYSIGLDVHGIVHHWGNPWSGTDLSGRVFGLQMTPTGPCIGISAGSFHATALRDDRIRLDVEADARDHTLKQPSLEATLTTIEQ